MTEKSISCCSVCYIHKGIILSSCGCFICGNCLQRINQNAPKCPQCSKPIDFSKVLDLRIKENLHKIGFIFDEPELHLKKVIESIKFQKMHQKKYINFLESKVDLLLKENNTLKATLQTSASVSLYNLNTARHCSTPINEGNEGSCNVIDMSKIKKIEPKRGNSNHNIMNKPMTNMNMMNTNNQSYTPSGSNINNLNAQTASGHFGNSTTTGKGILNVNINKPSSTYGNQNYYHMSDCSTPLNDATMHKNRSNNYPNHK